MPPTSTQLRSPDLNGRATDPARQLFRPMAPTLRLGTGIAMTLMVLSGSDLIWLFKADTTGIPDNTNMRAVGWSQDGRFLYAGGNWAANDVRQVRRWSDGGRGAYVDVPAASNAIFALIGLKSGSILIGSYLGLGFN